MDKSKLKTFSIETLNLILQNLSTKAGTVITVGVLITMAFSAGTIFNNFIKNIEILDIKKENFTEVQNLKTEIHYLKIEIKEAHLKYDILEKELTIKQNNDEKRQ